MRHPLRILFALGFALVSARAEEALPLCGTLDPVGKLSAEMHGAIDSILQEHERLSRQSGLVALGAGEGGDPAKQASELLTRFQENLAAPTSGFVILLTPQGAAIAAGPALEGWITAEDSERIARIQINPELKRGDWTRAAGLGLVAVLTQLEAQSIQEGTAQQRLQDAGFSGEWKARSKVGEGSMALLGILLGALIVAYGLFRLLAVEVIYTAEGWTRRPRRLWPRRINKRTGAGLITGGGASGSW